MYGWTGSVSLRAAGVEAHGLLGADTPLASLLSPAPTPRFTTMVGKKDTLKVGIWARADARWTQGAEPQRSSLPCAGAGAPRGLCHRTWWHP